MGVINAFNWIDGIDGFFGSQVLIAIMGMMILTGRISIFHIAFLSAMSPYVVMNLGLLGDKFNRNTASLNLNPSYLDDKLEIDFNIRYMDTKNDFADRVIFKTTFLL